MRSNSSSGSPALTCWLGCTSTRPTTPSNGARTTAGSSGTSSAGASSVSGTGSASAASAAPASASFSVVPARRVARPARFSAAGSAPSQRDQRLRATLRWACHQMAAHSSSSASSVSLQGSSRASSRQPAAAPSATDPAASDGAAGAIGTHSTCIGSHSSQARASSSPRSDGASTSASSGVCVLMVSLARAAQAVITSPSHCTYGALASGDTTPDSAATPLPDHHSAACR